ncbi:hypothetical protein H5P28_02100 [Ruficoccus amylovorans]|uniref:Lipoprotein n=1 Tax=Ruficoccus amylovorans TaxID=1804625 RepID=A0A842H942_9BACT|nr:hypothetical protein [Ruficoccus amylovorans]MBC2593043.1 hypothetical protein [Ruficoccus amylovorans]
MNRIKTFTTFSALSVAAVLPGTLFTGCGTLQNLWEQTPDTVKNVAVVLGKSAAKLALNIGFTAFLDGVNETDPYREQLLALLAAVDAAFETGADASGAARDIARQIAEAPLPDTTKSALIGTLMDSLQTQSEAEAGSVAAAPASTDANYGEAIYRQLDETRARFAAE